MGISESISFGELILGFSDRRICLFSMQRIYPHSACACFVNIGRHIFACAASRNDLWHQKTGRFATNYLCCCHRRVTQSVGQRAGLDFELQLTYLRRHCSTIAWSSISFRSKYRKLYATRFGPAHIFRRVRWIPN